MTQPSFMQTLPVWGRIGVLSFGGPAAQIALMHREIVEEHKWMSEREYLNALAFCMLLPGPEAMQLATYSGWRLHGVRGGLTVGLLFVLPGAAVILALAAIYLLYGTAPLLQSVFLGIKAAVLVIVLEALLRMSKRSLTRHSHWIIAGLSFIGLFCFNLPFPLVILLAGVYGFWSASLQSAPVNHSKVEVSPLRSLATIACWLVIWWAPIGAVGYFAGQDVLAEIGVFFSKLATVTFGGAYAVLAYMAQDAVEAKHWLSATEMMDGLGLAETTPGPLILVTEFVGFLAGARASGGVDLGAGIMAAGITLWATFAPCFLWVFTGAPYIEWIASKRRLSAALAAISAAVVGVILNLSIWFALHVLFADVQRHGFGPVAVWWPDLGTLDVWALALAGIAAVLLLVIKRSVLLTLALCSVLGMASSFVFTPFG